MIYLNIRSFTLRSCYPLSKLKQEPGFQSKDQRYVVQVYAAINATFISSSRVGAETRTRTAVGGYFPSAELPYLQTPASNVMYNVFEGSSGDKKGEKLRHAGSMQMPCVKSYAEACTRSQGIDTVAWDTKCFTTCC
jgi:hypothetical protein